MLLSNLHSELNDKTHVYIYIVTIVSVNELMITIGLLLAYVIDYIFMDYKDGWRWMFGFPVILAAAWAGLMAFMPVSVQIYHVYIPVYIFECMYVIYMYVVYHALIWFSYASFLLDWYIKTLT